VSKGGAGSGRNHAANQAPDIDCRSIPSFFGVLFSGLPGKEGEAGNYNDLIDTVQTLQVPVFSSMRLADGHKIQLFRISRPGNPIWLDDADSVTWIEEIAPSLDAVKHADKRILIW
jgi:hypothetical protein